MEWSTRGARFFRRQVRGAFGAVACALAACGGLDPSSPGSVAATVIRALDRGRADELLAVLPPDVELAATFDCGHGDTLRGVFQRKRDEARAELEARRAAGHRMKLHAFDLEGSRTDDLVVGDLFEGCTVRRPVTVHRSRVSVSLSKGGRAARDIETWNFLRFEPEGPWYFAKH